MVGTIMHIKTSTIYYEQLIKLRVLHIINIMKMNLIKN